MSQSSFQSNNNAIYFRHLASQLMEMEKVIERIMSTDFLDFAINILNQPYSEDVKLLEEVRAVAELFCY